MHSVCWRQQDVLHWKPERCLITVTKGRVTPTSQRQTYWHENFHFALFSHHTCYFQIVECNFKIIHLFWLPVEWSFAHRWLKNWVASPWADPKKNYYFFFFWKLRGEKCYFCALLSLAPLLLITPWWFWNSDFTGPEGQVFAPQERSLFLAMKPQHSPGSRLLCSGPARAEAAGAGGWAQAPRPSRQRPLRRAWSQPGWILARVQGRLKLINMQNKTSMSPTHALPLNRTTSHKARIKKLQTQMRTVGNQARDKIFPPEECWLLNCLFSQLNPFSTHFELNESSQWLIGKNWHFYRSNKKKTNQELLWFQAGF